MNNMFDTLFNEINKQIHKGIFPVNQLEPAKNPFNINDEDIEKIWSSLCIDCSEYSNVFSSLFSQWIISSQGWDRAVLPENADVPNKYFSYVNCIINAYSIPDDLWDNWPLFKAAMDLCPVVTQLDSVLWEGASCFFSYADSIRHDSKLQKVVNQSIEIQPDDEETVSDVVAKATILLSRLLQMIQEKELNSGKTIKVDASLSLEILFNSWEDLGQTFFIDLSDKESKNLNDLINERNRLFAWSLETKKHARSIAESTAASWQVFVELINDISSQERDVILSINQSISSFQKLEIIKKYDAFISEICAEMLPYKGKRYSLSRVFSQIDQRFTQAHNYCYVSSASMPAFKLTAAARLLVKDPTASFNYIFISYHKLRLEPTQNNARTFFSLVDRCVKVNLGVELQDHSYTSVDEMVEEFCATVKTFYFQHVEDINCLHFDEIQADIIDIVRHSAFEYSIENVEQVLADNIISMQTRFNSSAIEEIDSCMFAEEINHIFAKEQQNEEHFAKLSFARQLVTSMSIIYMVYSSMKRLIKSEPDIFENVDLVKRVHRELCEIDDELIRKVYRSSYDIDEYREDKGFDTIDLTEKESKANARLFEAFISDIEEISLSIYGQNVQELFISKQDIKDSIWHFSLRNLPDCIVKRLDFISCRLCNALVNCCKANSIDFSVIKAELISTLGERSKFLLPSVIETLVTAELLYKNYANRDCAESGFDYSSISALYYQSFEEAFNDLIWKPYATWINKQLDSGFSNDELSRLIPGDLSHYTYTIKKKKQRRASPSIEFGSIWYLMDNLKVDCTASYYCTYFAYLSGYKNKEEMFQDSSFANKRDTFKKDVWVAIPNRNNASHGGNTINLKQCTMDKKAVLDNLESIRSDSIGLIQQLLDIVKKVPNTSA